jgi:hypothetical protein
LPLDTPNATLDLRQIFSDVVIPILDLVIPGSEAPRNLLLAEE